MSNWQVPGYLQQVDGRLHMDGIDVSSLAKRYGTPLFVFSEKRIRHNVAQVQEAFHNSHVQTRIFYASKANSNLAVLQILRSTGIDIEVNSGGELYKALQAGFQPDQIIFNGVAKTEDEIAEAIRNRIFSLNVDSATELQRVLKVSQALGMPARVKLRMVPEIRTGSHGGLQTGTHESKFGISENELLDCYREVLANSVNFTLVGLHMHIGSQTPDARKYKTALEVLLTRAADLHAQTGFLVPYINIGGGIPVPYLKPDNEAHGLTAELFGILSASTPPSEIANFTVGQLGQNGFWESLGGETQVLRNSLQQMGVLVEPGRYIAADTAVLLAEVQNSKVRPGSNDAWLMIDAGFNTLLEAFDYNWYFHAIHASNEGKSLRPFKLAGPLCDSGDEFLDSERLDRLPNYRMLPEGAKVGDLLAFLDTGAYTLEQMSQYNGQRRAAAVMIRLSGEVQVIRKRDSYEDLLSHDLPLET